MTTIDSKNAPKLITLGNKGGPRYVKNGCWQTSTLLDINSTPYIIDCGLGVTSQMVNSGYQLADLNTILITHFHSDHTLELGTLLHTAWCSGLVNKVKIYAPKGLKEMMAGFFQYQKIDIDIRCQDESMTHLADLVELNEFEINRTQEGLIFEDDLVKVWGLKNIHPPFVETYAFRFEHQDYKITLSGDTSYCDALIDFACGSDILLHEVMLEQGLEQLIERLKESKPRIREHLYAAHTLAHDVAKIATQAKVKKLVLNHLIPCDMDGKKGIDEIQLTKMIRMAWSGELFIGRDGLVIEV